MQTITDVAKCGSCYGAEVNATHCCTTCQDVIEAYRHKRWNPNTDSFQQCKDEGYIDNDNAKLALTEGCQIYGHLEVNRVIILKKTLNAIINNLVPLRWVEVFMLRLEKVFP